MDTPTSKAYTPSPLGRLKAELWDLDKLENAYSKNSSNPEFYTKLRAIRAAISAIEIPPHQRAEADRLIAEHRPVEYDTYVKDYNDGMCKFFNRTHGLSNVRQASLKCRNLR